MNRTFNPMPEDQVALLAEDYRRAEAGHLSLEEYLRRLGIPPEMLAELVQRIEHLLGACDAAA